jgi:endonuclease/exonuclease/phosphatase family metal-dependent hydrolase/predicted phosphodiesterase
MKRRIISLLTIATLATTLANAHDIPPREDNALRIMSYNVHNLTGLDGRRDCKRIAGVINDAAPDLVALQELDSATARSARSYALAELAAETMMHPVYGPAIDFQGGKYGVGILSKEKPTGVRQIPLPGREEKRTLLIVEFKNYILACTHFSLTAADRLASVDIVNQAVKDATKPLFLAGDINAEASSEVQDALTRNFITLNDPRQNTIPTVNPNRCIDYIYMYRNSREASVIRRQVIPETVASDHLPLYVDVRIKTPESRVFRSKPFLQNPTNGGVTVSWFTTVPSHGWIEYGETPELQLKKELLVDGQVVCNIRNHKIRLEGLKPGATYYYRVCSREISLYQAYRKEFGPTVRSETFSFKTPSPNEQNFTAVIFNDLHRSKPVINALAKVLEEKNCKADFIIFNGDCIDDPANEEEAVDYLAFMSDKARAQTAPFFFLRGNHEIRNAYSIRLRDLVDYPGGQTFGAFSWGDSRFVLLDCGEDKPDTTYVYYSLNNFDAMRRDQARFLAEELGSPAWQAAARRFLIHHIPVYGLKGYNPCLELWGELLGSAPFDVSISGHTHRHACHPKGSLGNNFPVIIGGGNRVETSTVMILRKENNSFSLTVFNAQGSELYAVGD